MNNNNNFIDLINIASFLFGIMNLQENLTQGDKQDILDNLNWCAEKGAGNYKDNEGDFKKFLNK